ncbi:MAG: hypothetical protein EOQ39_29365 [Mesorhizobium sp.]|nr:MAG: hypothetical protein EOQ37_32650 [Mesorhizobium sp.]RWB11000.1 MAG: hypothetical protein EOQ39_29365 [Mesorhizobium sp.]RWB93810.1 MAG: hypothetical protein EOQ56_33275 [Mesorhizobium sp.]RWP55549.1 MAG: hypothetical protein EOR08_33910 [Mesorhizobium sp.]TIW65846.1 MAG: hypothetical protein E5V60_14660 [Mesorhizobium sp.]
MKVDGDVTFTGYKNVFSVDVDADSGAGDRLIVTGRMSGWTLMPLQLTARP